MLNNIHLVNFSPSLLATVDISTPTAPTLIDSTTSGFGFPNDLTFSGNRGYIVGSNTLTIFDYLASTTLGACSKAGEVIYDVPQATLKYCNGTTYYAMGPSPGAGGVGCVAPIAAPGQYQYSSADNRFRYCDGTNWVLVGN